MRNDYIVAFSVLCCPSSDDRTQHQSRPGARRAAGRGPPISRIGRLDRRGWDLTKAGVLGGWGRDVKRKCGFGRQAYPSQLPDYIAAPMPGRNRITAHTARATKASSTTAWVAMNGGSDCVGAKALRAGSFMNACATKTKTLR